MVAAPPDESIRHAASRRWRKPLAVFGSVILVIGVLLGVLTRDRVARPLSATSIAVLPFTDSSGSQDDEYFADGMTEELITALSKINGFHVAARTSAFTFKRRSVGAREMGRELHVAC